MIFGRSAKLTLAVFAAIMIIVAWLVLSPAHWLTPFAASVTIDSRRVSSSSYIGNPTNNESEAIVLVRVRGVGNYFLDLDNGTYRVASGTEFLTLGHRVWTLRDMRAGQFRDPLPTRGINQFRIGLANGRNIEVQF